MNASRSLVEPPATMPTGDDRLAFRGLLILLVVIGHNRLITDHHRVLFGLIYFWHVQSFFLEAMTQRSAASWANRRPIDLLVRYLVPFVAFVLLATLVGLARGQQSNPALVPQAIYSGYSVLLEEATGLSLYWFLPTFAAFSLLLVTRARIGAALPALRVPLDAGFGLAAVGIALWPPVVLAAWLPLGVALGIYIVPLALLYAALLSWSSAAPRRRIAVTIVSVTVVALRIVAIAWQDRIINLSIYRLGADLPDAVLEMAALIAMAYLAQRLVMVLPGRGVLRVLGGRSMIIYLTHPFVQFPLTVVLAARVTRFGTGATVAAGLAVVVASVAACLAGALILERLPRLRTMILPRDLAVWRAALWLATASERVAERPGSAAGERID